jgi:ribosomal protein S18 acetylase RimI-like enzyme
MIIQQANIEDAAEILKLQKLAYQSEAKLYNDYSIPPLIQSLAELEAEFDRQYFFKVSLGDRKIIGSVRAFIRQGTCFIGRLIVHPDFQNQGIGTSLMHEIERCFGHPRRFELFTGHLSVHNLHLYRKLGYREFKRERSTRSWSLCIWKKTAQPPNKALAYPECY